MINPNQVWLRALNQTLTNNEYTVCPRGHEVKEILGYNYKTSISRPIITIAERKLNYPFMFAEAHWICSGKNSYDYITGYLKDYGAYSDDKFTYNGAYGPKIMDQISWAAAELANDMDSRRAYVNIWRERPGPSADIPCTCGYQFIIRDGKLNALVNMRSQDVVFGMPYDIFTFSMIAVLMQQVLWKHHDIGVATGNLYVRAGSMHLYARHYEDAGKWLTADSQQEHEAEEALADVRDTADPRQFVQNLDLAAARLKCL